MEPGFSLLALLLHGTPVPGETKILLQDHPDLVISWTITPLEPIRELKSSGLLILGTETAPMFFIWMGMPIPG